MQAFTTTRDGNPLGMMLGGSDRFSNFVVPAAGMDGAPPGFDPNHPPQTVIVDPGSMESFVLEPSKLTKAALADAARTNSVRTPGLDLEGMRAKGSQALMSAAMMSRAMPINGEGIVTMPPQPQFQQQPTPMTQMPQVPQDRVAAAMQPGLTNMLPTPSPSSLFARTRGTQNVTKTPQATTNDPGPPRIKVKFEIEGNPLQFEGYYHDLVLSDTSLVLVFDTRSVGFPKQFPPAVPDKIAVEIPDKQVVVIISSESQHRFIFEGREFCVVEIVQIVPQA